MKETVLKCRYMKMSVLEDGPLCRLTEQRLFSNPSHSEPVLAWSWRDVGQVSLLFGYESYAQRQALR